MITKTAFILIGPSGSGKSTFVQNLYGQYVEDSVGYFSLDACRLQFFAAEKFDLTREENIELYKAAYEHAIKHGKEFDAVVSSAWKKALTHDVVIVDNTNSTRKSRARWMQDLRRGGYEIIMVEFMTPLDVIIARQKTRTDKEVPEDAVRRQFMMQESALLGTECDRIQIVRGF